MTVADLEAQVIDLRDRGPVIEVEFDLLPALKQEARDAGEEVPSAVRIRALVDTGTTTTIVDAVQVASKLMLEIHDKDSAGTMGGVLSLDVAAGVLRILTSRGVLEWTLPVVWVAKVPHAGLEDGFECVIGRDVLKDAEFVYLGLENRFTISFPRKAP